MPLLKMPRTTATVNRLFTVEGRDSMHGDMIIVVNVLLYTRMQRVLSNNKTNDDMQSHEAYNSLFTP